MNPYYKNNQGFSLLEILIAVAILAASLVSLMIAQGSSFVASERGEALTQANFLARQKMAEMQIELEEDLSKGKFPESESESEGTFDAPNEDYRWSYSVKKVEIPMVEGAAEEGSDNGNSVNPGNSALAGSYMKNVMDQISKSVREINLTVYWGDPDQKKEEQQQLSVTTHIVKL